MTGGYWPDIIAAAAVVIGFIMLYALWRAGYRQGLEEGRLLEQNARNTAAIRQRQAAAAPAVDPWASWEAEIRMTQPIAHGGHHAILAAARKPEYRPYGAHAITTPRNTSTTLIGSGITAPTVSGALRVLQARADKFIADLAAQEDGYRRGIGS